MLGWFRRKVTNIHELSAQVDNVATVVLFILTHVYACCSPLSDSFYISLSQFCSPFYTALFDLSDFFSRRIYDLQKKDVSFDSPIAMLGTLSPTFLKMLKSTFESWLERHLELSNRFCKEVVYGLVSNCYCSDLTLHAFAGKWTSIKGL